jgi:septum formation topological specificity factor MinE
MLDQLERPATRNVKDSDAATRIAVVCLSDRVEPFLPSSIPHLQLDLLAVHLHTLYFEIKADSALVRLIEYI